MGLPSSSSSSSWPSSNELDTVRMVVTAMCRVKGEEVKVVFSPYRICPFGAHIDHQGGTVSAMTISKGVLLGFVPSGNQEVLLRSGQFKGEVRFSIDDNQYPDQTGNEESIGFANDSVDDYFWGNYAKGALFALKRGGHALTQGFTGFISGSEGLDSSGLSSSAAVGIAILLAFQTSNKLALSPEENIELDRLIENEYLGLKNGILDQSAILLSRYGCLMRMNCNTMGYELIQPPNFNEDQHSRAESFKILLAFSGLKQCLTANPGYNARVSECQEAARVLLLASGKEKMESLLCNVEPGEYEAHKNKLTRTLAKRAEHYFSENMRVSQGCQAWATGKLEDFGRLVSASGLSSIHNYECGCEPLIQLYEIVRKAPGVFGCRFSGAGFRGCCVAFVKADQATEAASYVRLEYPKVQPALAKELNQETAVLICESGDSACVI